MERLTGGLKKRGRRAVSRAAWAFLAIILTFLPLADVCIEGLERAWSACLFGLGLWYVCSGEFNCAGRRRSAVDWS